MIKTSKFGSNCGKFGIVLRFLMITSLIMMFLIVPTANNIASAVKPKNQLTSAEAMATIEASTGRLLYAKDENKKLPMASTTKIITAIVAIESGKDLDEKHIIPDKAVGIEGSSIYLKKGEHLSLRELLYGLMLRSGNDSAVAIAIIVSGSVENFVNEMNNFCMRLGLTSTHLVTVNGLHDDNHYTTAFELARITAYAMKNQTFKEIVSTKEKIIDNELDKKNKIRLLKNKNKLLKNLSGADGVKTGYTKKAGRCFVGSATRNGMQIICVVLNCGPMFEETENLIDKAFNEFKLVKLLDKGELAKATEDGGKLKGLPLVLQNDIYYPLKPSEYSKVKGTVAYNKTEINSSNNLQEVATIKIELENNLIFSEKLYTIFIEEKTNFEDSLKKIIDRF